MSASQSYDGRTIKGKKSCGVNPPPLANPGHSGPTTFFLRSEKDLEKSTQRGRKTSRAETRDGRQVTPSSSAMGDSSLGVESLSDTISSAPPSEGSLSRTTSNSTEAGAQEAGIAGSTVSGRKRKAGNPVHPSILATGQRILSAERLPSVSASPMSYRSSESPYRSHLRRGSATSSLNLNSQPLTPLKMSPQPESAMPSTPRTGSPKSFRLSDEECSMADETGSQAIQSSCGDEDEVAETDGTRDGSMPQLVMPSISVPVRRPFTERGQRINRLKVMVVGRQGVGKTSLVRSIFRTCQDIVHVDHTPGTTASTSLPDCGEDITENYASTRAYPSWWKDYFESCKMLPRRKGSSGRDGILKRNVCLVDTPGLDEARKTKDVLNYLDSSLRRVANVENMTEMELIGLLSGEGGSQIDAVLWVFHPDELAETEERLEGRDKELLEKLCISTNVIPVLSHADQVPEAHLAALKARMCDYFSAIGHEPFTLIDPNREVDTDDDRYTFAVSSALSNDADTIDASILMSSQYLQPLLPSQLPCLVDSLFEPENVARMRHLSATKFLLWRQQNASQHNDLHKQDLLHSPQFGHTIPSSFPSTGSMVLDEPSKVLVPHGSSSYFRSASPSAVSDASGAVSGGEQTSAYALAHYNNQTQGPVPFRQVRLAKWAQDLQRGLENERKRYKEMYLRTTSPDWRVRSAESGDAACHDDEKAVALGSSSHARVGHRPARGRLGGDIGVIDPRDPLGILSFAQGFRRRGWFALRVAGGCGLLGAMAWWAMRNWAEVQRWFGGEQPAIVTQAALPPPPETGVLGWVEDLGVDWKGFFGWER